MSVEPDRVELWKCCRFMWQVADSRSLIARAEELYSSLRIERLAANGVARHHERHYGMIVYPSIKSARPVTDAIFDEPPLSGSARLYVHIPFCTGLCSFCHFLLTSPSRIDRYMTTLRREIELLAERRGEMTFHGSFIGGGTPTILPERHMRGLLDSVFGMLKTDRQGFNTIEMHPEFVHQPDALERLQAMRAAGLNRISIGVQAFDPQVLLNLKRRHTVEDNYRAIELSRQAGFDYVDIDLMYALPGQTLESWAHTLEVAAELPIDSISIFYLIVKAHTPIADAVPQTPNFSTRREAVLMHIMACERLLQAGYEQVLTDHFHKPWPEPTPTPEEDPTAEEAIVYSAFSVIPVGPSGWGYTNRHHYWNTFDFQEYETLIGQGRLSVTRSVSLAGEEILRRDIMFGLKYGGFDIAALNRRHQTDVLRRFRATFELLDHLDLVKVEGKTARLTYQGRLFLEETCAFFFSNEILRDTHPRRTFPVGDLLDRFHYLVTPNDVPARRVLMIVAHPGELSLTRAMAAAFQEGAIDAGHHVDTINLYEEDYEPRLRWEEIGAAPSDDVARHQRLIAESELLVFFFPIWWYSAPAILRGWFERTFTRGFGFDSEQAGDYRGRLGEKQALVFCTGADTVERFHGVWGRDFLANQIDHVFATVGIQQRQVRVILQIHEGQPDAWKDVLEEARFVGTQCTLPAWMEPAQRTVVRSIDDRFQPQDLPSRTALLS